MSAEDLDFNNQAIERLSCEYDGVDMEIGFSAKFLIEMLNTLQGEEVRLELSIPSRPGLLFPMQDKEDANITMLIMPVMLNSYE
jgi:DNA polymerase-3 subunit beta